MNINFIRLQMYYYVRNIIKLFKLNLDTELEFKIKHNTSVSLKFFVTE